MISAEEAEPIRSTQTRARRVGNAEQHTSAPGIAAAQVGQVLRIQRCSSFAGSGEADGPSLTPQDRMRR